MVIQCKHCRTLNDYEKPDGNYKHYNYRGGSEKLQFILCKKCCWHIYLTEPKQL